MCLSDTLKVTPPPRLQLQIATTTARSRKTQMASKVLVHAGRAQSGVAARGFSPASHRPDEWTFGDEPIDAVRTQSCVSTAEAQGARSYYEPLTFLIRSSRGGFSPVEVLDTAGTDGS